MVSDEIFPIGKEVPEEADDGMILRNRISGAELSGSAPVVLSYVLRWCCGCNPDYAQRMIARPSQQTIKNIMVMALRVLSPSVPGGAVIL